MTWFSPELVATLQLVDEMIDCRAQLEVCTNDERRAQLESAMRVRSYQIWEYLDAVEHVA